jgi:hypothetical protein
MHLHVIWHKFTMCTENCLKGFTVFACLVYAKPKSIFPKRVFLMLVRHCYWLK